MTAKATLPHFERTTARTWLAGALLVLLVVVVYAPTLNNGFIWDDETYLEGNTKLHSLSGLRDIWFVWGAIPQYYPVVHSTFWTEYQLWGLDPRGYHVDNLLLHAACALLLWRLLLRLEVPGAWWAAAVFAVHPLNVETVAWATERKNVLSLALALGSMILYLRFSPARATSNATADRTPEDSAPKEPVGVKLSQPAGPVLREGWDYELSLGLFCLALLSKSVVVSMPAVLLVIYWWKRGRITVRDVVQLAPFFAIAAVMAMVTVWLEKSHVGAEGVDWDFTLVERTLIAGRALWFYAGKILWPWPLIFFYPRWTIDPHAAWQYLYPAAAIGLVLLLTILQKRIGRGPLAAVLIFGGVLVPALGFFNVYPFRYTFVADHFQFHAAIALMTLAAACAALVAGRLGSQARLAAGAVGAGLLVLLAVVAHQKTYAYRDLPTLYADTLALNPEAWVAHTNLAGYLLNHGETEAAREHFAQALRIVPPDQWHRYELEDAIRVTGRNREAIATYQRLLQENPDPREVAELHFRLADGLMLEGETDRAIEHFQAAIAANPRHHRAYYNYGVALRIKGDNQEAMKQIRAAVKIVPNFAHGLYGLGTLLLEEGRPREAITALTKAAVLMPGNFKYREDLATALLAVSEQPEALVQLQASLAINPHNADALNRLGEIYARQGNKRMAAEAFDRALAIDPEHKAAAANRSRL